jgi:hypothetical protein
MAFGAVADGFCSSYVSVVEDTESKRFVVERVDPEVAPALS